MRLSALCWLAVPLAISILFTPTVAKSAPLEPPAPFGIDQRVAWTTSKINGSPDPPAPYRTERVFPSLQFTKPVVLTNAPRTDRLFVVELAGKIYSFRPSVLQDGKGQKELFFDLKADVAGSDRTYGLTFHPQFAENRLCYLCYTIGEKKKDGTRVSRFRVNDTDPPTIDADSEQILLTWRSGGHNGGCLKFGPDGFLYISTGDAGPAFPPDPLLSGQDVSNLRSSVLRIDVDHPTTVQPYSIPADNPFVDLDGARPEVWAYGFRNPWKMSFDPPTGSLWVGDVGWELWEMIYRVERAANYGWSLVEGPQAVHRERTRGPTPVSPPTVAHSHIESRSITGGFVYRGSRLPDLAGHYVYGDYVTGKIWSVPVTTEEGGTARELVDTALQIICFGIDNDNELYVVAYDGTLHRLVANPRGQTNRQFPEKLSETGLFASVTDHSVAPGVIPYRIKAEPWMDGAVAERFVALPETTSLDIHESNNVQIGFIKGAWKFPHNSVLMKTISIEIGGDDVATRLERLETQILHFDVDTWRAYTYAWNETQTDAVRVRQGFDRQISVFEPFAEGGRRLQTWHFASPTECLLCHTTRGGTVYGFNPSQLDCDLDYARTRDNQLRTLAHIGLMAKTPRPAYPTIVDPYYSVATLEERARSYLHVNCAHCHRRGGGGTAAMDVQLQLPLAKTNLLDQRPTQGTFGIHAAQVVTPGDPFSSVLFYRMAKTGRGRMPYIGSSVVDEHGLRLMRSWITELARYRSVKTDSRTAAYDNLAALRQFDADVDAPKIAHLLTDTSSALMLSLKHLSPEAMAESVRQAMELPDPQIRDLFERFLPEDQRVKRLGREFDVADILKLEGRAAVGRTNFLTSKSLQCRNCHRLGTQGRSLGPDLDGVGKKYSRLQLLDSIMKPSKNIDPKFMAHLVETSEGRVFTGLLVKKDEVEVVLKDAQAKELHFAVDEIELLVPQQKSLMPDMLWQDMTAQELADLLAFLLSLKS
jgi:putative heme-binding domain-containing protein